MRGLIVSYFYLKLVFGGHRYPAIAGGRERPFGHGSSFPCEGPRGDSIREDSADVSGTRGACDIATPFIYRVCCVCMYMTSFTNRGRRS